VSADGERDGRAILDAMNRRHRAERDGDSRLDARIGSYELAAKLQLSAPEALDLSGESEETRKLYGLDRKITEDFGRSCLTARRLLERGVRFVQVWSGAGQPWDNHQNIQESISKLAKDSDQALGALIQDLKQRGMLDDTLVIWGGEFGRTPTVEGRPGKAAGRDHQSSGFSMWMAGGGVKGGTVHGRTDEFGVHAIGDDTVHVHDLHATILHLMGFDHEKFTYRYAGRDFRLTDVHGRVVKDLIA
jgi:hypothetical protein